MTYFVIENYVNLRYKWQFGNDLYFELTTPPQSMTTDKLYTSCLEKGNADFPTNKNMCDFVKTTYGEYMYSLLITYRKSSTYCPTTYFNNLNMSTI